MIDSMAASPMCRCAMIPATAKPPVTRDGVIFAPDGSPFSPEVMSTMADDGERIVFRLGDSELARALEQLRRKMNEQLLNGYSHSD